MSTVTDWTALGRRAVAAKYWRWLPGMRVGPHRVYLGPDGMLCRQKEGGASGLGIEYLPDLRDPARGTDTLAARAAEEFGLAVHPMAADWIRYGHAAGSRRNQAMLDTHPRPSLVITFPGGRGTADMVRRAKDAGVPVRIVADRNQPDLL